MQNADDRLKPRLVKVLGGRRQTDGAAAAAIDHPSSSKGSPPETISNWSDSLQSLLDQPPATFPLRVVLGGMLFCGGFGIWAYTGQIDEVGQARGQLVPQGDLYKVHPTQMGKITRIAIKEGQRVRAGEVLVEFDSQIASSEVDRLRNQLTAEQTQLTQLRSLVDRTRLEAFSRVEISSATANAQRAAILQAQSQANTTRQMLAQLISDAATQQARLDKLKPLVAEGALPSERLFEVEQTLRDRQRSITQSQGELAQTEAEISRLQAELTQKQAEGTRTQLEAQQQTEQLEVDRTQQQAKIAETQTLIANAKAKLGQQVLLAPINGTISSLAIRNPGEVVQPGQTIAELSTQNAPLILKASLPDREAGLCEWGCLFRSN